MNKTINFTVTGMSCQGCVKKIETAFENLKGDKNLKVDVNLNQGLVTLKFNQNDEFKVQSLKAAIVDLGFKVEGVKIE